MNFGREGHSQHEKSARAFPEKHSQMSTAHVSRECAIRKLSEFLQEFDRYIALYSRMKTARERELEVRLLRIGKQVKLGTRTWANQDLQDIASLKGLRPLMLMMERNSSDVERQFEQAIRMKDEPSRISALCEIRGVGPVLVSMVLAFTWPEKYGFMDYHTCNALSQIGFDFPRKYCTSRFTLPQFLTYLSSLRTLQQSKHVNAMKIAKALYAFDSIK